MRKTESTNKMVGVFLFEYVHSDNSSARYTYYQAMHDTHDVLICMYTSMKMFKNKMAELNPNILEIKLIMI